MNKKILLVAAVIGLTSLAGCGSKKEKVIIYSSINTTRIAELQNLLSEKFPKIDCIVEYRGTSEQTNKIFAEGVGTECDITHDLAYTSCAKLNDAGLFADLSTLDLELDFSRLCDDTKIDAKHYLPECRTGGAIVVNTKVLREKHLSEPTSYEDLLDDQYKGLVSMPNPSSSGTGYMFVKAFKNVWGEDDTLNYFKNLSKNVLQFTSSGNAPITALLQEEVAVGLCMTANAVTEINKGSTDLKIIIPEDVGSPFTLYGQAIIKGKETRKCVRDVFNYLTTTYLEITLDKYAPEKILNDRGVSVENFPLNIKYCDMSGDTISEKEHLLSRWTEVVGI